MAPGYRTKEPKDSSQTSSLATGLQHPHCTQPPASERGPRPAALPFGRAKAESPCHVRNPQIRFHVEYHLP